MVIGGHGDKTMIPLSRFASYNGLPITNFLNANEIESVVSSTMVGGATLTKLLGTSAWYAPGAAISYLVESVLNDSKRIIPCSVFLEGEYGQSELCIGVPCTIGKNGIEEILDLKLNDEEKNKFKNSADSVRAMNESLQENL